VSKKHPVRKKHSVQNMCENKVPGLLL